MNVKNVYIKDPKSFERLSIKGIINDYLDDYLCPKKYTINIYGEDTGYYEFGTQVGLLYAAQFKNLYIEEKLYNFKKLYNLVSYPNMEKIVSIFKKMKKNNLNSIKNIDLKKLNFCFDIGFQIGFYTYLSKNSKINTKVRIWSDKKLNELPIVQIRNKKWNLWYILLNLELNENITF